MTELQLTPHEINVLSVVTKNRKELPHGWLRGTAKLFHMSKPAQDVMEIILNDGKVPSELLGCPHLPQKCVIAGYYLQWWDDILSEEASVDKSVDNTVDKSPCSPNLKSLPVSTVRSPLAVIHESSL